MSVLGDSTVLHIPLTESDHVGLLVEVRHTEVTANRGRKRPKPFRYENMWKEHGEYMEFVDRAWDPGPGVADLSTAVRALTSLQDSLKTWDREVFGSVKKTSERAASAIRGGEGEGEHLVPWADGQGTRYYGSAI